MPPPLAHKLQKLDAALNELKAWKEHAAAPKRAALIEEMEALIDAALEPQALADRIRQLQNDWKTVSKGVVSDSDADWQRFHQAAQSAYQPCREYFEAQAKVRQVNSAKRKTILERLRAFEAAQSSGETDWRARGGRVAGRRRRSGAGIFRWSARPAERSRRNSMPRSAGCRADSPRGTPAMPGKAIAHPARRRAPRPAGRPRGRQRQSSVCKRNGKRWARPHATKSRACGRRFAGTATRSFKSGSGAHADYTASLQANKARAAALCEELEQLAAQSGPALGDDAAKVAEWRSAFETLGDLPRGEERTLRARFERAHERVQAALTRQRVLEQEQSIADLLEAARRIHAYGWAAARTAPSSELDALKRAAETFIAGVSRFPKGGAEALTTAWANADAAACTDPAADADADAAARETALRVLCIRGEILTDRPRRPRITPRDASTRCAA